MCSRVPWIVFAGACMALVGTAGTAAAIVVAHASHPTRDTFIARQHAYPPQLVMRGDRLEIGYKAQRGPNQAQTPTASGTLYVRNDLQRSYTAVPLAIRKKLQARGLWAVVPDKLLTGHKLYYYGVIRDEVTGETVTVPARGSRTPESVWIVNDALRVNLRKHVFGQTAEPEAIVARAGPTEVGFGRDGLVYGPSSFAVAKDRSIWLLDWLNTRVLVWDAGHPDTVARRMRVRDGSELALGPGGSLYLARGGPVTHLSARGSFLWANAVVGGSQLLRTGPDGTLYCIGGGIDSRTFSNWLQQWVPVATPAGRPLSLAEQRRSIRWTQPLAGGLQLVAVSAGWRQAPGGPAPHEARVALVDRSDRIVRSWRVTSSTNIWWYMSKTPTLVGGDPVIVLTASRRVGARWKNEYLVLRLGPKGEVRTRFSLPADDPPRSVYGDAIDPLMATDLRIEPDGKLYQLGSAPDFGAAISRFSLAPGRASR